MNVTKIESFHVLVELPLTFNFDLISSRMPKHSDYEENEIKENVHFAFLHYTSDQPSRSIQLLRLDLRIT